MTDNPHYNAELAMGYHNASDREHYKFSCEQKWNKDLQQRVAVLERMAGLMLDRIMMCPINVPDFECPNSFCKDRRGNTGKGCWKKYITKQAEQALATEKTIEHAKSPEGQVAIKDVMDKAKKTAKKIKEQRRIKPESLNKPFGKESE